jgi:hypothetical protein
MKIGAVTSGVAAEILDAPIPFPLSANLRYQLTQTVNVFRDSLQAEVTMKMNEFVSCMATSSVCGTVYVSGAQEVS